MLETPGEVQPATETTLPTQVRHAVVALATLMAVLLYLDRICLSFLEPYLRADLHLSREQGDFLLSAFFWTYALAQVPMGWLSDRFGARLMLSLYILGWSLCTGLMGLAASFAAVLVCRFVCGLAQAGAYPTSAGLISKWAPFAVRGRASSLVATGGRIGGVAAPILTAYLLVALTALGASSSGAGWRLTVMVYGAIGLVVAALFWLVVRDRPRDHPRCNAAEVALIEGGRPPGASSPHGRADRLPLGSLLRSRSLWLSSFAQLCINFGWAFVILKLPDHLAEVYHVPVVQRGWLAGLPLLVGIAGMLAGGWLTDRLTRAVGLRWGRRLPMVLTCLVTIGAFATCVRCESAWQVTAALSVAAFATDLGVPAIWAFMQDAGGRHVGSVLGWGNMWGNLGAALSPLVLGRVIDLGGWNAGFLACAAAFLLAGVAALGIDATIAIAPAETSSDDAQSPASSGTT